MLFALSLCVGIGAARSLWTHRGAEFSFARIALAAAAIPIMYLLATAVWTFGERALLARREHHACDREGIIIKPEETWRLAGSRRPREGFVRHW